MSEETPRTMEEIFGNKFKDVSIKQLEETIGAAVSELIGVKVTCSIDGITFPASFGQTRAKFGVLLTEPYKL